MANNILTATVAIKGTRVILWSHFGPDAIPLEKEERTGVAGNDPEEWRKRVLMTEDRQLYLDPSYIFGTIIAGSQNIKKGRGSIQPMVRSTLQVVDGAILIDRFVPDEPLPTDPTKPVYLDVRSVKNPATKARNVRYRVAAAPGWSASFQIEWDKVIVSRGEMESAVRFAGQLAGVGDGRNIGFGRFSLESFQVDPNGSA